jgi:ParB-like nuclease family protein
MRMPWAPSKLDLDPILAPDQADFFNPKTAPTGEPLLAPVDLLEEDPGNPRTEFPEGELAELAADVGLHGILQPIVVRRPDSEGRYRVLFSTKRLRAAKLAGLREVPVVIGTSAHDVYAQVAENQKRHGLSPLDLAKFMRSRVDAGVERRDRAAHGYRPDDGCASPGVADLATRARRSLQKRALHIAQDAL